MDIMQRLPEEIAECAIPSVINWVAIKDILPIKHKICLLWDGERVHEGWRLDKENKGEYPFIISMTKEKVYNIIAWAAVEPPCL